MDAISSGTFHRRDVLRACLPEAGRRSRTRKRRRCRVPDRRLPGACAVANLLWGAGGNDEIHGEGGGDSLLGSLGADTLHGGAGHDT